MSKDIQHSVRKHSLLAPSSAHRWINCTPSVRLQESYTNTYSTFALEGTLAHEMAEAILSYDLDLIDKQEYERILEEIEDSPFYYDGMRGDVEVYTNYVLDEYHYLSGKDKDTLILIEARADLGFMIKGDSGSVDCAIIAPNEGLIKVIDLKFGRGVQVDAEDNPQLKIYAYGLLFGLSKDLKALESVDTIEMAIMQPRLSTAPKEATIARSELNTWIDDVVLPSAQKAIKGEGEQVAGEWCKFCKVKPQCRALYDMAQEELKREFGDPAVLDDEEILEIYAKASVLQDWLSSVQGYILSTAMEGKEWEGLKVVEGRSVRAWRDQDEVIKILQEQGYDEDLIINKKLKGIGDIEKLVKKSNFGSLLGDLVVKPMGKPTLAPLTDKRQPYDFASAHEFTPFEDSEE